MDCDLKICNFESSIPIFQGGKERKKNIDEDECYQFYSQYKPPEVILSNIYDKSLDIWSIGCIFAELLNRKPLFKKWITGTY